MLSSLEASGGSQTDLVWRGSPWPLKPLFGAGKLSSFLPPGAKHRWMVEGQRGAPRRGRGHAVPRGGAGHKAKRVTGVRGGRQGPRPPFHCALCQLQVNSETQLKQVGQVQLGWGGGWSRGEEVGPSARLGGGSLRGGGG